MGLEQFRRAGGPYVEGFLDEIRLLAAIVVVYVAVYTRGLLIAHPDVPTTPSMKPPIASSIAGVVDPDLQASRQSRI